MRIMHPELAIAIGRDGQTLDADALDAGLVGLDEDRSRAARDPQHLEAQGRHGDALGHHDHRYAADDAVTFGLDGEQAAPGRRLLQHGHVAQQPREMEHERLRLLAEHRKSGHRKFRVEIGMNVRAARFSEHHARIADGIGKNPVIARQRPQSRAHLLVEIAEGVCDELGIEPVGLGEHGVERDHHGAEPGQVGNDVGDARPRPRPLTESRIGQAPFVDVDDRDRPHRLLAWFQHLEEIEGSYPHLGDRSRIPNPQRGKADQQRKADQPRIPEAPLEPPPYDPQPFHAVWISRLGGLSRRKTLLPTVLQRVHRPEPRTARPSRMNDKVGGVDAANADVLQEDGVGRIDRDQGVSRVRR